MDQDEGLGLSVSMDQDEGLGLSVSMDQDEGLGLSVSMDQDEGLGLSVSMDQDEVSGEQTEKQIKKEFEKLHQFLREEEEARRAELRMEEEQKKSKIVEWIELELQSLSDRVMEVEGEMGNDDVTFLANYHSTYRRAQCKPSDSQLNSGSVIDVTKHVGNLRFRVWEKMKDLCPYYPVILNPNSSHMAVSGDLVGASGSARRFYPPNPLQKAANRMVLGSQVLKGKLNCWEVDVGNGKNWTVGVCTRRGAESNQTQPLTPHNGIWGVCRNGDFCDPVGSWGSRFQITKPLKTLRVKLIQRQDFNNGKKMWTLSFADASDNSRIVSLVIDDGVGREFIPFLIPEDVNSPLRIVPVNVNTVTENKFGFFERHKEMMPLYFMVFIVLLMVMMLGFRALFTSQSAK
ncbi:hypothetical protein HF521_012579 [Silurus meridionalis]|uniref:Uncharacterized protein n=1 Tax=Silurus meridionalis TaxID=175797 RepID=A0A8T0AF42_SILME|nr:hypothetical protein HF521_012579 [Silurus meridionalis]